MRVPPHEIFFTFSRSGGPGGQNVNKVNSRATLHWYPAQSSLAVDVKARFLQRFAARLSNTGEFTINGSRHREQHRNMQDCLEKLDELLETVAHPPKRRRPTKPTKGAKERRLESKKRRSHTKKHRGSALHEAD